MLSLGELEQVLTHWERIDGRWSEAIREECAEFIAENNRYTLAEWIDLLIEVPVDVCDRYQRVIDLAKQRGLINEAEYAHELGVLQRCGGAILVRRGKEFAQWLRATKC